MLQYSKAFSRYAGVAPVAQWLKQEGIWEKIEAAVPIKQKTVRHSPHEKLKDAFIQTLLGEERLVTINTGIRADRGVQRLFGRERCAEQSLVSTTLNRCDEASVAGLEAVLAALLQRYGRCQRHAFDKRYLLLDGDMTGLTCGRQAEGSSKGYFAGKKGPVAGSWAAF